MKAFTYLRPKTVDEAAAALMDHPEALPLAGGMSLLSSMKLGLNDPSHLIDLQDLGLAGITDGGDTLTIGAMTRHADVAASPLIAERLQALGKLARGIGDRQVRNRGTIGGSLANNDPAACYPSATLGLGATVVTNQRRIAADDFFVDMFTTDLEEGELITEVVFPIPSAAAYIKFHQQASRFAMIGVFAARFADGTVRIAITGGGDGVFRPKAVEELLTGGDHAARIDPELIDLDLMAGDIHADPVYRRNLAAVGIERAMAEIALQAADA
ncbi:MAG: xanthine dehydrogenase family protein subunit M [Pseudomonadota bacterium]|nr:xanthine dehydrogenase family protein subunit M [Pseudomonadota bacterium]